MAKNYDLPILEHNPQNVLAVSYTHLTLPTS